MKILRRMVLAALACVAVIAAAGADWPQFRGPGANGVATQANVPTEWGADLNIAWKTDLPGVAWSQPIVVGDKVFVATAITDNQRKPSTGGGFGGFGARGTLIPPPGKAQAANSVAPPAEQSGFRRAKTGAPGVARENADTDSAKTEEKTKENANETPPGQRGGFAGKGGMRGGGFGQPPGGFNPGRVPPDATYRWKVLCLDLGTGDLLWEQLAKEGKPTIPTQPSNTYASETPVSDGEYIYAYFGMTGLFCFDLEGKLVWSKNLGSFPMSGGWGTGSSPVLEGNRLFVQCDNEEKSFIVALDKRSGDELWRVAREESSNWCTPYVWKNIVRTELVTSGSKVRSYDPETGKLLWEYGKIGSGSKATPVGDEHLLYVGTGGGGGMPGFGGKGGFGGGPPRGGGAAPAGDAASGGRQANSPLVAIKAGATGDISLVDKTTANEGVAWSMERAGPPMASPLLYEGCLYVLDQRGGIIGCYDATSGKQHYRERLPDARGFTASPWAANGKVFFLDDSGQTFAVRVGPKLEVLATNRLSGMFWSSAAIADGKLLLRSVDSLYCVAAP